MSLTPPSGREQIRRTNVRILLYSQAHRFGTTRWQRIGYRGAGVR